MEELRKEYMLSVMKRAVVCAAYAGDGSGFIRLLKQELGSVPLKDVLDALEGIGIERLESLLYER
jgi:hypothetical protein